MTEDKNMEPAAGDPVQAVINHTIKEVFKRVAGIEIRDCTIPHVMSQDLQVVYTTFSGGYEIRFAFYAEAKLWKRITENMLDIQDAKEDDIEECAKEFVNILCGHIVKSIFEKTKTAARFQSPYFVKGNCIPGGSSDSSVVATHYADEYFDMAILFNDQISSAETLG